MTAAVDALRVSAVEQAALVRSGELSARELVEASLAAIERLDPAVNAFVRVCAERALAEADAVRPGDPRPLCGVPIGVKDLLVAPPRGCRRRTAAPRSATGSPTTTAAHVRRLREAGAIVVGKTNTPELGLRPVTENARFGATRNPLEPRALGRRLVGRQRGRGRRRHGRPRRRQRPRRLDPDPGRPAAASSA